MHWNGHWCKFYDSCIQTYHLRLNESRPTNFSNDRQNLWNASRGKFPQGNLLVSLSRRLNDNNNSRNTEIHLLIRYLLLLEKHALEKINSVPFPLYVTFRHTCSFQSMHIFLQTTSPRQDVIFIYRTRKVIFIEITCLVHITFIDRYLTADKRSFVLPRK